MDQIVKVRIPTSGGGFELKAQTEEAANLVARTESVRAAIEVFFGPGVQLLSVRLSGADEGGEVDEPDPSPWPPIVSGIDTSRTCPGCGCKSVAHGVCTRCGTSKALPSLVRTKGNP
jgi:hypothetical protein